MASGSNQGMRALLGLPPENHSIYVLLHQLWPSKSSQSVGIRGRLLNHRISLLDRYAVFPWQHSLGLLGGIDGSRVFLTDQFPRAAFALGVLDDDTKCRSQAALYLYLSFRYLQATPSVSIMLSLHVDAHSSIAGIIAVPQTKMVPELTTCDFCGRTVVVLSWSPIFDDAAALELLDDSHTLEISCKIDCPKCGTSIKSVNPTTESPFEAA